MPIMRYERTLNTTSCSRACSTTFGPKSSFGPTSAVADAFDRWSVHIEAITAGSY
jgi:hypothetical protein